MRIGIIQLNIVWKDKIKNFEKAKNFTALAKQSNCDLVILPEAFNTGFCMDPNLAEDEGGETDRFLTNLARSNKINIIAGYFLKRNGELKNVARVFTKEGNIIGTYEKIHLFSLLKEDKIFKAGSYPTLFNINNVPFTVFICYDLRFPEVFRLISYQVWLIFIIANWPKSRADHWLSLLKARAIENLCYVVGVNRVGKDGNGIDYSGDSVIYDPWGELILKLEEEEGVLICDLDINRVLEIRSGFPFIKDQKFTPQFQESLEKPQALFF
ncbi:MAG: carbon-nitrogen family hydrolase [Thermodesulfovibrio sp.]|nr:carbon-nitrogen family hydrolase [Thermodesulfovibrio sp.]